MDTTNEIIERLLNRIENLAQRLQNCQNDLEKANHTARNLTARNLKYYSPKEIAMDLCKVGRGNKIEALKFYKNIMGCGLIEAKDAINQWWGK